MLGTAAPAVAARGRGAISRLQQADLTAMKIFFERRKAHM